MKGRYGNKGAILSRFVIDDTSICLINVHLGVSPPRNCLASCSPPFSQPPVKHTAVNETTTSSTSWKTSPPSRTSRVRHQARTPSVAEERPSLITSCASSRAISTTGSTSGGISSSLRWRKGTTLRSFRTTSCSKAWRRTRAFACGRSRRPRSRLRLRTSGSTRLDPLCSSLIAVFRCRYDPGTDSYDGSAKKRIPAWCDRVLYRASFASSFALMADALYSSTGADRPDKIKPLHYQRYECNVSDHRPISAAFDLQIKSIVPEKRSKVWLEVEQAWFGVERELLSKAREFYGVA